eukprot:2585516-Rhodomonas_salina.1
MLPYAAPIRCKQIPYAATVCCYPAVGSADATCAKPLPYAATLHHTAAPVCCYPTPYCRYRMLLRDADA